MVAGSYVKEELDPRVSELADRERQRIYCKGRRLGCLATTGAPAVGASRRYSGGVPGGRRAFVLGFRDGREERPEIPASLASLAALRRTADASPSLDGEGLQAWMDFELEALRLGVDPDLTFSEILDLDHQLLNLEGRDQPLSEAPSRTVENEQRSAA